MKDQAQLQTGLAGALLFQPCFDSQGLNTMYRDVVLVGSLWHHFTTCHFLKDSKVLAGPLVGWCPVALWWQ